MLKVIWLLNRKQGVTTRQFRERYERHAKLAQKYFGHLMTGYRRNYRTESSGGTSPDCVGEWMMPNEEAFNEIKRILADPVIGKEFDQDMEDFLDRNAAIMIKCEEVDTGTGDGHATRAHTRKI